MLYPAPASPLIKTYDEQSLACKNNEPNNRVSIGQWLVPYHTFGQIYTEPGLQAKKKNNKKKTSTP